MGVRPKSAGKPGLPRDTGKRVCAYVGSTSIPEGVCCPLGQKKRLTAEMQGPFSTQGLGIGSIRSEGHLSFRVPSNGEEA